MATTTRSSADGWTDAERAAMKERAAELRTARGKGAGKAAKEAQACLDAIEALSGTDREICERVHAVVAEQAPDLAAKTYYGMPAYARDGKVVVFVQPASKFGARYATLGFEGEARLDDGPMWPTSYAVTGLDATVVAAIRDLVRRAAEG